MNPYVTPNNTYSESARSDEQKVAPNFNCFLSPDHDVTMTDVAPPNPFALPLGDIATFAVPDPAPQPQHQDVAQSHGMWNQYDGAFFGRGFLGQANSRNGVFQGSPEERMHHVASWVNSVESTKPVSANENEPNVRTTHSTIRRKAKSAKTNQCISPEEHSLSQSVGSNPDPNREVPGANQQ